MSPASRADYVTYCSCSIARQPDTTDGDHRAAVTSPRRVRLLVSADSIPPAIVHTATGGGTRDGVHAGAAKWICRPKVLPLPPTPGSCLYASAVQYENLKSV